MRILYLHQYFKTPQMSGGTRSYEMSRRMAAAGHDVHVVTSRTDGAKLLEVENVDGVHVHWIRVSYDNDMSYRRRIVAFALFGILATFVGLRRKCDVIFATSTPLTIIVPATIVRILRRVPLVFEVRDLWPELPIAMGALNGRLMKAIALHMERFAYRSSTRVVALSPGMKQGVVKQGIDPELVDVIPNSSDRAIFQVDSSVGSAFRADRPWLGDRKLVVYAGTLGHINDVGYLVEVAHEVVLLDPEIRFLIIGAGVERPSIENQADELGLLGRTVFMEAPIPKELMPSVMNAADLCTSLFLPMPEMEANSANKFFDALAAGRPIAINYGGWQADLLAATGAGIVLSRVVSEAASAIVDLLGDERLLKSARQASEALARDEFDRDLLADRLSAVIEAAVAQ